MEVNAHRKSITTRTSLIAALSVSAGTIVLIMYLTMDKSTWSTVSKINPFIFLILLGLVTGKWFSTCLRTLVLIRATGENLSFWKTVKSVLAGSFTGSVTPFHAAGIPTEIFFLTRYGLSAGIATAVITSGAAISILFFILALPVILVLSAAKIEVSFGVRTLLVTAGIIGFSFFLIVIYSMKDPKKVANFLRNHSPDFIRSRESFERFIERFTTAIGDYSRGLGLILKSGSKTLASAISLTFLFWGSGFLVAPFILVGLGYPQHFWKAMLAQLVVSCLQPFIPLPGESGFAEAVFAGVFIIFVPRNLVGFVTLSWRFFMFYFVLLIQGIAFIIAVRDAAKIKRERITQNLSRTQCETGRVSPDK